MFWDLGQDTVHIQKTLSQSLGELFRVCVRDRVESRHAKVDVIILGVVTDSVAVGNNGAEDHGQVVFRRNLGQK